MSVRKVVGRGGSADFPLFVTSGSSFTSTTYNIAANGAQTPIDTSSEKCLSIQVEGTFDADLTFEVSNDQANWEPVCVKQVKGGIVSQVNFNAAADNRVYNYAAEACFFRVVAANYVSGTANVTICSSSTGCTVGEDLASAQLCEQVLVDSLAIVAGSNAAPAVDLGSLFTRHTIQLLLSGADTFTSASVTVKGSVDGVNFVTLRTFANLTYAEITECLYLIDCDVSIKHIQVCLDAVVSVTGPDIILDVVSNHSSG